MRKECHEFFESKALHFLGRERVYTPYKNNDQTLDQLAKAIADDEDATVITLALYPITSLFEKILPLLSQHRLRDVFMASNVFVFNDLPELGNTFHNNLFDCMWAAYPHVRKIELFQIEEFRKQKPMLTNGIVDSAIWRLLKDKLLDKTEYQQASRSALTYLVTGMYSADLLDILDCEILREDVYIAAMFHQAGVLDSLLSKKPCDLNEPMEPFLNTNKYGLEPPIPEKIVPKSSLILSCVLREIDSAEKARAYIPTICVLLKHGASLTQEDSLKETGLDLIAKNPHFDFTYLAFYLKNLRGEEQSKLAAAFGWESNSFIDVLNIPDEHFRDIFPIFTGRLPLKVLHTERPSEKTSSLKEEILAEKEKLFSDMIAKIDPKIYP